MAVLFVFLLFIGLKHGIHIIGCIIILIKSATDLQKSLKFIGNLRLFANVYHVLVTVTTRIDIELAVIVVHLLNNG